MDLEARGKDGYRPLTGFSFFVLSSEEPKPEPKPKPKPELPSPYGGSFFVLYLYFHMVLVALSSYRPLTGVLFLFSQGGRIVIDCKQAKVTVPLRGFFFCSRNCSALSI